jgi:plasmid stabilization system protein ParE
VLPVHLLPEAEADLIEAREWYDQCRRGLGDEFLDAVSETVEHIAEQPFSFACVHRETRRAVLSRFPYGVYFRLLPDHIVLIAVMHGRRHPRQWQTRW